MTSPNPKLVLELFEKLCGSDFWVSVQPVGRWFSRDRIYTLAVVVRLMIIQRLLDNGTLIEAVQHLARSWQAGTAVDARPGPRTMSVRTGAYCRARQKLPMHVLAEVFETIVERLRGWLPSQREFGDLPVFVVDGTTLPLCHAPELLASYPPSSNQHGKSHWPLLRLLVLQDVRTGLALRPQWGPVYGPNAVGEQELAIQALAQLSSGAVLMGDRNFGIFSLAWAASQRQHPVLLRLTQARAEHLATVPLPQQSEQSICWQPSRWDRCGAPFPPQAAVTGRLLCLASADSQAEPFYFFTTLPWPADQILALYLLRWNVETDLRAIKRTVQLQRLSARTETMLGKELLAALAAYNLVRAVICMTAEKVGVPPRRLSFTNVYTLVETFLPDLLASKTPEERQMVWDRIVSLACGYLLPRRSQTRSFPRKVWRKGPGFPFYDSVKT